MINLNRSDSKFVDIWLQNYIRNYIDREIRRLFPDHNIEVYKKFISMIAFSSGDIINYSNFARSLDVSQPTIKKYFEIAHGTFLWRTVKAFDKNCKKRIVKISKGHLRDSGLISYFLKIPSVELMNQHPYYGRIWESVIIE